MQRPLFHSRHPFQDHAAESCIRFNNFSPWVLAPISFYSSFKFYLDSSLLEYGVTNISPSTEFASGLVKTSPSGKFSFYNISVLLSFTKLFLCLPDECLNPTRTFLINIFFNSIEQVRINC